MNLVVRPISQRLKRLTIGVIFIMIDKVDLQTL
jgi:hypothetical protein